MKRSSYGERDYAFGQRMLTLRTSIGLTQADLAPHLGVSRKAVARWEAGESYPTAHHLKALLTLGVRQQAFPPGREEEEIRAFWKAAHPKELLDESWLSGLLKQPSAPPGLVLVEESGGADSGSAPPAAATDAKWAWQSGQRPLPLEPLASRSPADSGPRLDWGEALDVPSFYGREEELATLSQWIVEERCRVVSVLGQGGLGKSALVTRAMQRLAEHFEVVLFRSLRDAPSCEALLESCLAVLAPLALGQESLERRLSLLLEELRRSRVLLVLDNLEVLLQEGVVLGRLRPGLEAYGQLLRQVAQTAHQSCLLLTSREKPAALRALEGSRTLVRSLRLSGLDAAAGEQLLAEHELSGSPEERARLLQAYSGNPLALNIVAETIADLFGGAIHPFLAAKTAIFGSISELLEQQWARLSPLEQTLLCWLAILREPVTLEELQAVLVTRLSPVQLLEAVDGLHRRSLVERGQRRGSFTLQSVVLEYVTERLVSTASQELVQGRLALLHEHGLSQARAKDYVRQTQERLLLAPVLTGLQRVGLSRAEVEGRLRELLDEMRELAEAVQGYAPANLVALLRLLRGHLRGLDLSHLFLREAYLQGVEMQDTSLMEANLRNVAFTEVFHAIWAVAVSPRGTFWAAGDSQGEVRVWREGGHSLHLAWQAHTETIERALAFSPDERFLATGSWDGTIKLWDVESGALLWTGWHTYFVENLAFAPNGQMIASCADDATIRLWDVKSGANVQTIADQCIVYAVAWSGDGTHLASSYCDGHVQVWELQATQPATCVQTLFGHSNCVQGLAFAPDGNRLASSSWDQTVRIWDVESGRCLHRLEGHTERVHCLAWSPDGRTVASAGFDNTIWLWDAETGSYRAVLQGHTAPVYSIAFTPDSRLLLSGSEDRTLRVWDVESGYCVSIIQGYAGAQYDVAWSSEGKRLASVGTDMLVTLWEVAAETLPRELPGHRWLVQGVAWSPNGGLLASAGWDNSIRLWDPATGACTQILRDPDYHNTLFFSVAWSPDGQLLASGTYMHGVYVWDMTTLTRLWVGHAHRTWVRRVAWSPDGTRLASCGDDGSICLWRASDGTLLQTFQEHSAKVATMAWSPDGNWLASGGGNRSSGELFVWHSGNGKHHPTWGAGNSTFERQPHEVSAVVWNKLGDQLVSGDSDGNLRWWEVESGKCLAMRKAHQGAVHALKISPDGQLLASCSEDGAIKVWNLQSTELLRTLRRDRPYERLNITRTQGLTPAQKVTLFALGAFEEDGDAPPRQAELR